MSPFVPVAVADAGVFCVAMRIVSLVVAISAPKNESSATPIPPAINVDPVVGAVDGVVFVDSKIPAM